MLQDEKKSYCAFNVILAEVALCMSQMKPEKREKPVKKMADCITCHPTPTKKKKMKGLANSSISFFRTSLDIIFHLDSDTY